MKWLADRTPRGRDRAGPVEKWQQVAGFGVFFEHLFSSVYGVGQDLAVSGLPSTLASIKVHD
jgi:hypothetical protein